MPRDWSLTVSVDPTLEPVTVAEAKRNCDLPESDSTRDSQLQEWITTARQRLEHDARIALIDQTLQYRRHTFTDDRCDVVGFSLPRWPVDSVTSVQYQDSSDSQQTLSTDVYGVDTVRRPSVVYLKKNQSWPALYGGYDDVLVTYVAGYGTTRADVPSIAKTAILIMVRHLWDNPQLATADEIREMPEGWCTIVEQLRGGAYV